MVTLEAWLNRHRSDDRDVMFKSLVDHFGIKIPIVAAQKPFVVGESVFLTLPPFLLSSYQGFLSPELSIGKLIITSLDEENGYYSLRNPDNEYQSIWLPCFFFHRNSDLACSMYKEQLEIMLATEKKEMKDGIDRYDRTYQCIPKMLMSTSKEREEWYIEEYKGHTIKDLRQRANSLGF